MTSVKNYLNDGADHQARAVLAFAQDTLYFDDNDANVLVARWENCREQGYILSLKSKDYKRQLNIIFFEHRNSDSIAAVMWEQYSMNSITIETAKFPADVYTDKYDVSFSVSYGEVREMSDWIIQQFTTFWGVTTDEVVKDTGN